MQDEFVVSVRGEFVLEDGVAVGSNQYMRELIAETRIIEPNTLVEVFPKDGERYLRALPFTFSGYYHQAVPIRREEVPPGAVTVY